MTENETIKELETSIDLAKMCTQNYDRKNEIQVYEMAIKALEEVQQYRQIGSVELFAETKKLSDLTKKCGTIGKVFDECAEYAAIGTSEECREAVEKQTAKKIISFDYNNGTVNYGCPVCKRKIISKIDGEWCGGTFNEYCDRCGQKLDWRVNDEDTD